MHRPGDRQASAGMNADPSRSLQRELNRLISGVVQMSQVPGDLAEKRGE